MTEPTSKPSQQWDELNLPVLTELAEDQAEDPVPDLSLEAVLEPEPGVEADPAAHLAPPAAQATAPVEELELELPPDLELELGDELAAAQREGPLGPPDFSFEDLPSLDLEVGGPAHAAEAASTPPPVVSAEPVPMPEREPEPSIEAMAPEEFVFDMMTDQPASPPPADSLPGALETAPPAAAAIDLPEPVPQALESEAWDGATGLAEPSGEVDADDYLADILPPPVEAPVEEGPEMPIWDALHKDEGWDVAPPPAGAEPPLMQADDIAPQALESAPSGWEEPHGQDLPIAEWGSDVPLATAPPAAELAAEEPEELSLDAVLTEAAELPELAEVVEDTAEEAWAVEIESIEAQPAESDSIQAQPVEEAETLGVEANETESMAAVPTATELAETELVDAAMMEAAMPDITDFEVVDIEAVEPMASAASEPEHAASAPEVPEAPQATEVSVAESAASPFVFELTDELVAPEPEAAVPEIPELAEYELPEEGEPVAALETEMAAVLDMDQAPALDLDMADQEEPVIAGLEKEAVVAAEPMAEAMESPAVVDSSFPEAEQEPADITAVAAEAIEAPEQAVEAAVPELMAEPVPEPEPADFDLTELMPDEWAVETPPQLDSSADLSEVVGGDAPIPSEIEQTAQADTLPEQPAGPISTPSFEPAAELAASDVFEVLPEEEPAHATPVLDMPFEVMADEPAASVEPPVAYAEVPAAHVEGNVADDELPAEAWFEEELLDAPPVAQPALEQANEPVSLEPEPEPEDGWNLEEPVIDVSELPALEADSFEPLAPPAAPAFQPVQSIDLDSLPRGVLQGGIPEVEPETEQAAADPLAALQARLEQIRHQLDSNYQEEPAVFRTPPQREWASVLAEEPVPVQEPTSAPELAVTEPQPEPMAAMPLEEPAQPGEVVPAAQAVPSEPEPEHEHEQFPAESFPDLGSAALPPAVRPEQNAAVVGEAQLIESLYEKILPRMKVELGLWLQDALELQSKQLLSGVMQQLKEDYEPMFGETLRESLRQVIGEVGRLELSSTPLSLQHEQERKGE
jgi:hypothetical protein